MSPDLFLSVIKKGHFSGLTLSFHPSPEVGELQREAHSRPRDVGSPRERWRVCAGLLFQTPSAASSMTVIISALCMGSSPWLSWNAPEETLTLPGVTVSHNTDGRNARTALFNQTAPALTASRDAASTEARGVTGCGASRTAAAAWAGPRHLACSVVALPPISGSVFFALRRS